jgi:hypothetical protein
LPTIKKLRYSTRDPLMDHKERLMSKKSNRNLDPLL